MYTSQDNIEKLQRVETLTIEQDEVFKNIEHEILENCMEDEKEFGIDFSTTAGKICCTQVKDQFATLRNEL